MSPILRGAMSNSLTHGVLPLEEWTPWRIFRPRLIAQAQKARWAKLKSGQKSRRNGQRTGFPILCAVLITLVALKLSRLLKGDKTETSHEHVASDVGRGETAPAGAVRAPVIDHGVGWGLWNDAGVGGDQHAVNIEFHCTFGPHAFVRVETFFGCERRLRSRPLFPAHARPGCPPQRAGILSFNLRRVDLRLRVVHEDEARADLAGDGYARSRRSA